MYPISYPVGIVADTAIFTLAVAVTIALCRTLKVNCLEAPAVGAVMVLTHIPTFPELVIKENPFMDKAFAVKDCTIYEFTVGYY